MPVVQVFLCRHPALQKEEMKAHLAAKQRDLEAIGDAGGFIHKTNTQHPPSPPPWYVRFWRWVTRQPVQPEQPRQEPPEIAPMDEADPWLNYKRVAIPGVTVHENPFPEWVQKVCQDAELFFDDFNWCYMQKYADRHAAQPVYEKLIERFEQVDGIEAGVNVRLMLDHPELEGLDVY